MANESSVRDCIDLKGKDRRWTYFVKIVAVVGEDTYKADKEGETVQYWYRNGETEIEIGPVIGEHMQ